MVPAAAALLVIYMSLIINLKRKKAIIACGLISELILLVLFLTLRISDGNLFCGFACFSIIIAMFYTCVFGISVNRDERSVLRDISYGSFGAFVVITAAVIFLLTEGEVLDGLEPDIADIGISEKRKKQRHKG